MKSWKRFCLLYIFVCCIGSFQIIADAQTAPPEPIQQTAAAQIAEENLIHAGDLVDVDIVGSTEFDWRGTLGADGFLSNVNFSDAPVYALCQTEETVAARVADSYRKILREPQVVVKILDRSNRPAAILYGAVRKNQRFQIKRPIFLSELIIISGGFSEQVADEIEIFRSLNSNCSRTNTEAADRNKNAAADRLMKVKISDLLAGRAEANPQILSGDVVTVAEAKPLYVTGGVLAPKQIPVRASLTLSRAIDSAGGLSKDADAKEIRIFRRSGLVTDSIVADLEKIRAGQAADVNLQPFDVVEVPQSGRERRNFPPVVKEFAASERKAENLPLKIID